jgi:hypothetical protein
MRWGWGAAQVEVSYLAVASNKWVFELQGRDVTVCDQDTHRRRAPLLPG